MHDDKVRSAMSRGIDALLPLVQRQVGLVYVGTGENAVPRPPAGSEPEKGELAMGVYALVSMGKITGDERLKFDSREMQPAVKAVREMTSHNTYVISLQALALAQLPARPEFRKDLERVRDQLLLGASDGAFTYECPAVFTQTRSDGVEERKVEEFDKRLRTAETWDNSNGQYGLLGVWAASDAGLDVPEKFWKQVDAHWRGCQLPNGGWPYMLVGGRVANSSYGHPVSMSAAGVANLFMGMERLDNAVRFGPARDRAIESGVAHLEKELPGLRHRLGSDPYLAFSVERAGLATGIKRIGGVDWYKDGAAATLSQQLVDGTWRYRHSPILGTSYALMFLSRGRAPVVVSKLRYAGPWATRPRDAARVTRWVSHKTETMLNWQVVDLRGPDDGAAWLDDSPILLITGQGDPRFSLADLKRMQQFVEAGGLIVSTSDNDDAAFTNAIRRQYAPAVCGKKHEMRDLPKDHSAYRINYKVEADDVKLLGLSNGARELWIHSPQDLAGTWQGNETTLRLPQWEVAGNLFSYVAGREPLRGRLDPLTVTALRPPRHKVALGRLGYGGNDDPEPQAWARFGKLCAVRHSTELVVRPVRIGNLNAAGNPVVHMTGTAAVALTPAHRGLLVDYLRNGGTLVADAVGGSDAFIESFQALLTQAMPEARLERVPADHAVLTGKFPGGAAIEELRPRRFNLQPENAGRPLQLMELKINGRTAVLLFTGDITSGLLGTNTWGIFGWSPRTSEALAWNAVMWARKQK